MSELGDYNTKYISKMGKKGYRKTPLLRMINRDDHMGGQYE